MITQPAKSFLPLFRSWFDTGTLADKVGGVGLEGNNQNILAELDLGPMVEAETSLLNHAPSSAVEAVCLLEVVRQNMADAGRSDGLDVRAITAVQQWLATGSAGSAGNEAVERLLRQSQI